MQDDHLNKFNLAGGTALALYLGHRKSIDLDFFTADDFDAAKLEKYMTDNYNFKASYLEQNTLKGFIDEVKIDYITHNYPYLEPPFRSTEGIRLYSIKDITAMKLAAISDNGTRVKDFIDIAYLSTQLSLNEMLLTYETKFPNASSIRPLKGLTYFQDIDFNEPIQMIDTNYNWKYIEKRLHEMIKKTGLVFSATPIA